MTIEEQIRKAKGDGTAFGRSVDELALGYLRYEALRKLSPRQFNALCERNMHGENFDEMVDEILTSGEAPQ